MMTESAVWCVQQFRIQRSTIKISNLKCQRWNQFERKLLKPPNSSLHSGNIFKNLLKTFLNFTEKKFNKEGKSSKRFSVLILNLN